MNRTKRRWLAAIVATGLAYGTGCSYGPLHGTNLGSSLQADFKGFATAANAEVRVEYFRWSTGVWTHLATTHADATPWNGNPPFTTSLYQWYVYPTVPAAGWNASKQARLRARQLVGSNYVDMYMYDEAGFECLSERFIEELFDGDNEALNAQSNGIDCSDNGAGDTRHEVIVTRP
jgi:hypothetical protein